LVVIVTPRNEIKNIDATTQKYKTSSGFAKEHFFFCYVHHRSKLQNFKNPKSVTYQGC